MTEQLQTWKHATPLTLGVVTNLFNACAATRGHGLWTAAFSVREKNTDLPDGTVRSLSQGDGCIEILIAQEEEVVCLGVKVPDEFDIDELEGELREVLKDGRSLMSLRSEPARATPAEKEKEGKNPAREEPRRLERKSTLMPGPKAVRKQDESPSLLSRLRRDEGLRKETLGCLTRAADKKGVLTNVQVRSALAKATGNSELDGYDSANVSRHLQKYGILVNKGKKFVSGGAIIYYTFRPDKWDEAWKEEPASTTRNLGRKTQQPKSGHRRSKSTQKAFDKAREAAKRAIEDIRAKISKIDARIVRLGEKLEERIAGLREEKQALEEELRGSEQLLQVLENTTGAEEEE